MKKLFIILIFIILCFNLYSKEEIVFELEEQINSYIKDGQVYKLKKFNKYKLEDIALLKSNAEKYENLSKNKDDGYYLIFDKNDKISYIYYMKNNLIYVVYEYYYNIYESNEITDIKVIENENLMAMIKILKNHEKYSKLIYSYTGVGTIREMIFVRNLKTHDEIIGYQMPDFSKIYYKMDYYDGEFKNIEILQSKISVNSDWGDTLISPTFAGIFFYIDKWFSKSSTNKYSIVNTFPLENNVILPINIEVIVNTSTKYKISCVYEESNPNILPIIKQLRIKNLLSGNYIAYRKNKENNTYQVNVFTNSKEKNIGNIVELDYKNIKINIDSYLK